MHVCLMRMRIRDTGPRQEQDGKTSLGPGVQPVGGGIFKSAAVAVLRQERKLMSTGEITRCAHWVKPARIYPHMLAWAMDTF